MMKKIMKKKMMKKMMKKMKKKKFMSGVTMKVLSFVQSINTQLTNKVPAR
jgi:hypothetical protein